MQQVVQGLSGFKIAKNEPGTHYILTQDEYNDIIHEKQNSKKTIQCLKDAYNTDISAVKRDMSDQASEERSQMIRDMRTMSDEIIRLKDLNRNLIRIAKERSNAQRKLTPKKTHKGYLVMSQGQTQYTHRSSKNTFNLTCWSVKIQTPYDAALPAEVIEEIERDLVDICKDMGIRTTVNNDKFNSAPKEQIDSIWGGSDNFIFRQRYKADLARGGMWTVELLVRSAIVIPPNMQANHPDGDADEE